MQESDQKIAVLNFLLAVFTAEIKIQELGSTMGQKQCDKILPGIRYCITLLESVKRRFGEQSNKK